jgi:hypothetical protein
VTSQNERQRLVSNKADFAASKGSGLTTMAREALINETLLRPRLGERLFC